MTVKKTISSSDGATINYIEYSDSTSHASTQPGLIILHGGLESSNTHSELAQILSIHFTVYLPDRRGRGGSSPHGAAFSIETEAEDLKALLRETGARSVMGVSSGALIVLYTALSLSSSSSENGLIQRMIIFEPPLALDDRAAFDRGRERFEREINAGMIDAALVTGMTLTKMTPFPLQVLPRWVLTPLIGLIRNLDLRRRPADSKDADSGVDRTHSLWDLLPTMRYDFQLVTEMQGSLEKLRALNEKDVDVLLMSASKSPTFLKRSVEDLEEAIPKAIHTRLQGLDHLATGNKDTGGRPDLVALELTKFLTAA